MKLIALYDRPDDPESFDEAYFNTHLPLLDKVPGLQETVVTRFGPAIMGDELHMMAVMTFEDEGALKAALNSPEMAAAGENLNQFAAGLVTLLTGQEAGP